jgi:hypothetical protein
MNNEAWEITPIPYLIGVINGNVPKMQISSSCRPGP